MSVKEFISTLNKWGKNKVPFLFLVDFEIEKPIAMRLADIHADEIVFNLNGFSNVKPDPLHDTLNIELGKEPIAFDAYREKFDIVYNHLIYGDSYLTNLTTSTRVAFNASLHELFHCSKAKYKLLFKDQFLVFSPETFVEIKQGKIFSYPMKGTIDATLSQAQERILRDPKEMAEHVTIVDLIRNDLSRIASDVRVTKFRYIDEIKTNNKNLLQVSSEVQGELPPGYLEKLGDILIDLLPAGSISGAPKYKTVKIIQEAEGVKRGYYTGVCGYFNGERLDSGVMIRFIERERENFFYRSGGGITTQSVAELEYQEAIDKVYVPVN